MEGQAGADAYVYRSASDIKADHPDTVIDFSTRQGDMIGQRLIEETRSALDGKLSR